MAFGGGDGGEAAPLKQAAYRISPAADIPDNDVAGLVDTFLLPDSIDITDINVFLNLTHTWVGDLVVEIISPEGTTVRLRNRAGSTRSDVKGWCGSPAVGDQLSLRRNLVGQNSAGTWRLRVRDEGAGNVGRLNEWGLSITGFPSRNVRTLSLNQSGNTKVAAYPAERN